MTVTLMGDSAGAGVRGGVFTQPLVEGGAPGKEAREPTLSRTSLGYVGEERECQARGQHEQRLGGGETM